MTTQVDLALDCLLQSKPIEIAGGWEFAEKMESLSVRNSLLARHCLELQTLCEKTQSQLDEETEINE